MNAFLLLTVCINLLCCTETARGDDIKETSSNTREKRSLISWLTASLTGRGYKAFMEIADGATEIQKTQRSRLFQKKGDYYTLLNDFEAVNPSGVRTDRIGSQVVKTGLVGDRLIKIRQRGYNSNPTLYLIQKPNKIGKSAHTDVFVYKNSPDIQPQKPAVDLYKIMQLD